MAKAGSSKLKKNPKFGQKIPFFFALLNVVIPLSISNITFEEQKTHLWIRNPIFHLDGGSTKTQKSQISSHQWEISRVGFFYHISPVGKKKFQTHSRDFQGFPATPCRNIWGNVYLKLLIVQLIYIKLAPGKRRFREGGMYKNQFLKVIILIFFYFFEQEKMLKSNPNVKVLKSNINS